MVDGTPKSPDKAVVGSPTDDRPGDRVFTRLSLHSKGIVLSILLSRRNSAPTDSDKVKS